MCVLSIKVPIRKKSGNLFNDPRISTPFWESTSRLLMKCAPQTFAGTVVFRHTSVLAFDHDGRRFCYSYRQPRQPHMWLVFKKWLYRNSCLQAIGYVTREICNLSSLLEGNKVSEKLILVGSARRQRRSSEIYKTVYKITIYPRCAKTLGYELIKELYISWYELITYSFKNIY